MLEEDPAALLATRFVAAHFYGDGAGRAAVVAEVFGRDQLPEFLQALAEIALYYGQAAYDGDLGIHLQGMLRHLEPAG